MRVSTIAMAALAATFLSTSIAKADDGPWQVRGRIIAVMPDISSTVSPIGGRASVDQAYVPELDISYFFNDNVSMELVLATTNHDVSAKATALGNVDLGDVWLLPPTLLMQYHFAPQATLNPYLGAGVNYTVTYASGLPTASPLVNIHYKDNVGLALQAGVDVKINDDWFWNVDVKKLFLNTRVTVDAGGLGIVRADVGLDPWIVGIGFGRKF
jgi:outer membrane protein